MSEKKYKKILILGSGALKIGEAGEFDYSGSQAIKALKEEGIRTILINPNIATIQTSEKMSNDVYFLPVNADFVEQVIEKERPDGMLLSFGGQTALNCGIALYKKGVLKKYGVDILGTPVTSIILTEDREKFAKHLAKIQVITPQSQASTNSTGAVNIAKKLGYPVMIRAGFTLGGQGSGVAKNEKELRAIVTKALSFSPQVLIEQYLHHFKEIEYEVVRDQFDNCITVCNMENMDPLGIHTGDSIVIAPSQTLTNDEYHTLRKISIEIVRSLKIVGECNVQFALNPTPKKNKGLDYAVIEVNARLSRSSALASKATGYPLAYIGAKLALGYNLSDLKNKVTGTTTACFEPALDYVVVKIPRFDLEKFHGAELKLGSAMKSVGEVMGIGRTFEESFQKAIRMLDLGYEGATDEKLFTTKNHILENVRTATPKRMFAIAKAIRNGVSIKKIYKLSGIDPWFLYRIAHIVALEEQLRTSAKITKELLLVYKQNGFSDKRIGELTGKTGLEVRKMRKDFGILPSIFQIDTLAGEFPAKTNYLYLTYNGGHSDVEPLLGDAVVVLGGGPYHIGSSVEFDWCSVSAVDKLREHKKKAVVINCNPETVSTDYDVSNRLYFEELTFERIADIYEFEKPQGIVVSVGGQTPNNRARALASYGANILGTSPADIDQAEDRNKFSALLDKLGIQQPAWESFTTYEKALSFSRSVGFPVLIRPSYVLSGQAMVICYAKEDLKKYLLEAAKISAEHPVTVSKFFEKSMEVELDAVAQNGKMKASIISEHIENAGVHSGDATIVLPCKRVSEKIQLQMNKIASQLANALNITGPFNMQFLLKDDDLFIIETNLRASRTFPFIAKVTGINLINMFIDALYTKDIMPQAMPFLPFTAVKVAQFSFSRLTGAYVTLGVEMASTGEVACFGKDTEEAYLKGMLATNGSIPKKGIFISLGSLEKKHAFIKGARYASKLGVALYATQHTSEFLAKHGIKTTTLYKIHENKSPNFLDYVRSGKIDLAINVVDKKARDVRDGHLIRRAVVDSNILLLTKIKKAELYLKALSEKDKKHLEIKPWSYYRAQRNRSSKKNKAVTVQKQIEETTPTVASL